MAKKTRHVVGRELGDSRIRRSLSTTKLPDEKWKSGIDLLFARSVTLNLPAKEDRPRDGGADGFKSHQ